jgi:hypothetical protein
MSWCDIPRRGLPEPHRLGLRGPGRQSEDGRRTRRSIEKRLAKIEAEAMDLRAQLTQLDD